MKAFTLCVLLTFALIHLIACRPQVWTPTPPKPTSLAKDFNVAWSITDPNGAPSNPLWASQRRPGQNLPPVTCNSLYYGSQCTDLKIVKDKAIFPNLAICSIFNLFPDLPGHADWMVAAYTGAIGWLNYAADSDFNFMLFPSDDAGLTSKNHQAQGMVKNGAPSNPPPFIEIEFDPSETVAHFTTPWWKGLMAKAQDFLDTGDPPRFNDRDREVLPCGVAFGLFGLDCEHGCRSEVHPIYALAIQVDDRGNDNTWAIFVRNWGNGGFCSRYDHQLSTDGNKLKVLLQRQTSNAPATITKDAYDFASTDKRVPLPSFEFLPNQGVEVTFNLPAPKDHVQAELVVHLHWTDDSGAFSCPVVRYTDLQQLRSIEKPDQPDSAEEYLNMLIRKKSLEQSKQRPRAMAGARPTQMLTGNEKMDLQVPTSRGPTTPKPVKPLDRLTVRGAEPAEEQGLLKKVCASYGTGNLPTDKVKEFNRICAQVLKKKQ